MTTATLTTKVNDFLAQKRIAVAGVSRNQSHHPVGNLIYQRLKKTGHDVFAVNPHMETFEGERCYPTVTAIPGGCLPDDVRSGRRLRARLHAVGAHVHRQTARVRDGVQACPMEPEAAIRTCRSAAGPDGDW